MTKRAIFGTALLIALVGCGGGKGTSEQLVSFSPGRTWTYQVTGSVTLPAGLGGGTQSLKNTSTLISKVASTTFKDLNNVDVGILDRQLNLMLVDGRVIKANVRLYFSQTSLGIFVHGVNDYVGDTTSSANDIFVPSTVTPAYKFLYLPNPVTQSVSYAKPFGLAGTADQSYSFALSSAKRQLLTVPAGTFLGYGAAINEAYASFKLTNAGLVPEVGIISGNLSATLADKTTLSATIVLTSYN